MRTTITLPDDLHHQLVSLASDRRLSFSRTVEELVRRGLGSAAAPYRMRRSDRTGLLTVGFGRPVTTEDVRSLDDED